MLSHLQRCGRCHNTVREFATVAQHLVGLVPEVDPPPGFAQRVLAALPMTSAAAMAARPPDVPTMMGPAGPRGWARPTRWLDPPRLTALAAVAVASMLAISVIALATDHHAHGSAPIAGPPTQNPAPAPPPEVIVASLIPETSGAELSTRRGLRTPGLSDREPTHLSRRQIGTVWIHPQQPAWIYLTISWTDGYDKPQGRQPVTCDLIPPSGSSITLGSFTVVNGHADWSTPTTTIDAHTLTHAQLTLRGGPTFARATFTTEAPNDDRTAGGGRSADPQQVSFRSSGRRHHQRLLDGWFYLRDQQQSADTHRPRDSPTPR